MIAYWIIIAVMILLSAFFSSSEMAYNVSNRNRLKAKAEEGGVSDRIAYYIVSRYDRMLTSILVGNNIANFAISTCATLIAVYLLCDKGNLMSAEGATTVATVVTTVVLLICGEIIPKMLAAALGERWAKFVAVPLRVVMFVFFPIVLVINAIVAVICFPFRKGGEEEMTADELGTIIEAGESEGSIGEERSEMLQSAIGFSEKTVKELLIPRVDMYAVDLSDEREVLFDEIRKSPFSRIPVYEGNADNMQGILNVTLFLKEMSRKGEDAVDVRSLLKKPYYLEKSVKLPVALDQMRNERQHFAMIPDEYGGIMGIVTMEDILEELVGDIWDENEEREEEVQQISSDEYDVDADMGISDFLEQFLPDEEFDNKEVTSAGGWVLCCLERYPEQVGETFRYKNLEITVTEMEERRLLRLHIRTLPEEQTEEITE